MSKAARRIILLWHRWLGLAAVPFVLLLAITGVLLERTDALDLDTSYVTSDWMLAWYGVAPADDPVSFPAGERWISWLDGTLYVDGEPVQRAVPVLTGATALESAIVAATGDALYLLTMDGELVEKVTPIGLAGTIDGVTAGPDNAVLIRAGGEVLISDIDMIAWRANNGGAIIWPESQAAPAAIQRALLESYRGTGLPQERVLLDLHSGRLIGSFGPYVMDGAALILLLLSATGVYNWVRRR